MDTGGSPISMRAFFARDERFDDLIGRLRSRPNLAPMLTTMASAGVKQLKSPTL